MKYENVRNLACPLCRTSLTFKGALEGDQIQEGHLQCSGCSRSWRVSGGIPRLYRDEDVRGTDRFMRFIYDALPSFHDPATRYLLPLLQGGGSEEAMRDGYMKRIDLASLSPRVDGQPVRILEIGVGTGANLPLLLRDLPEGLDAEIWGIDLSEGMLEGCRKTLSKGLAQNGNSTPRRAAPLPAIHLAIADAHALPFHDHMFDRVFHVGALGSFRDPGLALAEMARVSSPGAPIVVVDEQLDPARKHNLYYRATFRLLTFYDVDPHCPKELLPKGVGDVIEEQLSRFYYCLRFTVNSPLDKHDYRASPE